MRSSFFNAAGSYVENGLGGVAGRGRLTTAPVGGVGGCRGTGFLFRLKYSLAGHLQVVQGLEDLRLGGQGLLKQNRMSTYEFCFSVRIAGAGSGSWK